MRGSSCVVSRRVVVPQHEPSHRASCSLRRSDKDRNSFSPRGEREGKRDEKRDERETPNANETGKRLDAMTPRARRLPRVDPRLAARAQLVHRQSGLDWRPAARAEELADTLCMKFMARRLIRALSRRAASPLSRRLRYPGMISEIILPRARSPILPNSRDQTEQSSGPRVVVHDVTSR